MTNTRDKKIICWAAKTFASRFIFEASKRGILTNNNWAMIDKILLDVKNEFKEIK